MCELGDLENAHFATIFKQLLIIHAKKTLLVWKYLFTKFLHHLHSDFSTRMSAILKNLVVDMQ